MLTSSLKRNISKAMVACENNTGGVLLSEHEQQSIYDIRFSTAIRSDNCREILHR